ncbi:S8 family serine peptidase [Paenibacillus athensensis]|uniref:Uncharacterized protein n=1 Tax=Paenibacillus athensensis TaxID=1967502 RepID=A0A4Y8Q0V9_9BACL|nr:S8 family serine peptidase [Paenibacillus athensensis]MCD1258265.1 S8 family serine peptidase [Paenibacillus athensensis]
MFRKTTSMLVSLTLLSGFILPTSQAAQARIDASADSSVSSAVYGAEASGDSSVNTYIIKFKDEDQGKKSLQKSKKTIRKQFKHAQALTATLTAKEAAQLQADGNVQFVEPDAPIRKAAEQVMPNLTQIHVPEVQATGNLGSGVSIALLDTGVDTNSAELHIAGGVSFVPSEPTMEDWNGHGTGTAGVIGALKDNSGLLGIAPEASLYEIKVMDRNGQGTYSQVIEGIEWAIDHHIDIVSMSFTGSVYSQALKDAMQAAHDNGILLIAATGNDGAKNVEYPAKFPSVIGVGAVDGNNQIAPFSNTGKELQIVAPGVNIPSLGLHDTHVTMSGTSLAAPHVAGVAALIKASHPAYTNVDLRGALLGSATPLSDQSVYGNGLVNALAAFDSQSQGDGNKQQVNVSSLKKETLDQIKKQYSTKMLQIAAYFEPELTSLLTSDQLAEMLSWSEVDVETRIDGLTKVEQNWLRKLTPVDMVWQEDRKKPKKKAAVSPNASIQAASGFSFTEKNNPYTYKSDTDGAVDTMYRTANQKDVDVYLSGKHGLDVSLIRSYNSLAAKMAAPNYTQGTGCPTGSTINSSDYGPSQVSDCMQNALAAPGLLSAANPNYIAVGWSLNLPTMDQGVKTDFISANPVYVGTGKLNPTKVYYNRTYGDSNSYTYVEFILDDGSRYQFRNTSTSPYNYPYANVTYTKATDGTYYLKIDDGKLVYHFDATGRILDKKNFLGDQVLYAYSTNAVTITDTVGRTIQINNNGTRITSVSWKDNPTTFTRQIIYNTASNSYTFGGKDPNAAFGGTYDQLNSVQDETGHILKSYTYFQPSVTNHADYNFEDDYQYDQTNISGIPNPTLDIVSGSDPAESSLVANRDLATYSELPYLLLNAAIDDTGMTVQYQYDSYNPNWYTGTNYFSREASRHTVRLYLDPYMLTYIGYVPVRNVYFKYTNASGQQKVLTRTYMEMGGKPFSEIWGRPRQGGDYGNFRLSYASYRGGDQPKVATVTALGDYTEMKFYTYSALDREKYNLVHIMDSSSTASYDINEVRGSYRYTYSPKEETGFQFDPGMTKPYLVKTYDSGNPNDPKLSDSGLMNFLNTGNSRSYPSYYASYATLHKNEYDSYGYVTYDEDSYGNKTNTTYGGPYHMISNMKRTAADGLTSYQEATAYNPDGTIASITRTSTYPDPLYPTDPTKLKTDTIVVAYTSYDAVNKVPTHRRETGSGNQFSLYPITTDVDMAYDAKGFHVTTETTQITLKTGQSPTSVTLTHLYDGQDRPISTTFPDGSKAQYTYDNKDRMLTETYTPPTSNPGAAKTDSYSYDDPNRTITKTLADGEKDIIVYTPYGNVDKQQKQVGSSVVTTLVNQTNNAGNIIKEIDPFGDPAQKTTYTYANNGKVRTVTNALGETTTYSYANAAYFTSGSSTRLQDTVKAVTADGKQTWSYYDREGRLIQTDENGALFRTTTYQYTPLGQLSMQSIASGSSVETTRYGYGGMGHLIYIQDAMNQTYQYVYNRLDQMNAYYVNGSAQPQKTQTYNEVGWLLTQTNAANLSESFAYKTTGALESHTDKDGQMHVFSYTPYNQQSRVSIQKPAGTELYWQTNNYDPNTGLLLGTANSENETQTYHYDMWKRMDWQQVAGKTYSFGYDANDRLQTLTYPDSKQISYTYDNLNRMSSVSYPGMGTVNYSYTLAANQDTYTVSYPNGLSQKKQSDNFGQLTAVGHYNNSPTANWSEGFGYDKFGNILSINRNGSANSFTYDALNRVSSETTQGGSKSYSYDSLGNLQSVGIAGTSYVNTYDNANRISGYTQPGNVSTYSYDNRGNRLTKLQSGLTSSYSYNAVNELKTFADNSGTTASYSYYADGSRATKTVNGNVTRFVYYNGHPIEELSASGTTKSRNIWGNELIYRDNAGTDGKTGYYWYNGHGDVVKVTDASGSTLNSYDYDIWGNSIGKSETMLNPFRYAGQMQDDETGLIYLTARYYDPANQRFLTEDAYAGDLKTPLSLNQFTYAFNNPLTNGDPTGHYCEATVNGVHYSHPGACNDGKDGTARESGPGYTPDYLYYTTHPGSFNAPVKVETPPVVAGNRSFTVDNATGLQKDSVKVDQTAKVTITVAGTAGTNVTVKADGKVSVETPGGGKVDVSVQGGIVQAAKSGSVVYKQDISQAVEVSNIKMENKVHVIKPTARADGYVTLITTDTIFTMNMSNIIGVDAAEVKLKFTITSEISYSKEDADVIGALLLSSVGVGILKYVPKIPLWGQPSVI